MGLIEGSVGPLVSVEIEDEVSLPAVDVDPNQLEMALLNLAVNARDAMDARGVLTIKLAARNADEQNELGIQAGKYVVLSVRDTGEGMDAETLAKATEPFFSTKGLGKGTGLGLSMVFGLAQQSGGGLRLESIPVKGTTASLWLPVARRVSGPISPATSAPSEPSAAAKILFVDDDPLIAASTAALLQDLGHEVIEVHSAREALKLLQGGMLTDLLITDHAMPEMTGIALAREVRKQWPELPILLATGFAESGEENVTGIERLSKPYTQNDLATRIALLLPEKRVGS
jgi:CheY-like chemotaxis protein